MVLHVQRQRSRAVFASAVERFNIPILLGGKRVRIRILFAQGVPALIVVYQGVALAVTEENFFQAQAIAQPRLRRGNYHRHQQEQN